MAAEVFVEGHGRSVYAGFAVGGGGEFVDLVDGEAFAVGGDALLLSNPIE